MPITEEKPKDQFCFELGQFAVEQPVEGKKKRTLAATQLFSANNGVLTMM